METSRVPGVCRRVPRFIPAYLDASLEASRRPSIDGRIERRLGCIEGRLGRISRDASRYVVPESRYDLPESGNDVPESRYDVPESGYDVPESTYDVPEPRDASRDAVPGLRGACRDVGTHPGTYPRPPTEDLKELHRSAAGLSGETDLHTHFE